LALSFRKEQNAETRGNYTIDLSSAAAAAVRTARCEAEGKASREQQLS
jgi:hypothetical protein